METPPPSSGAAARASACAGGQTPDPAFSDNLENPAQRQLGGGVAPRPRPERLLLPGTPNTAGLDATYASSGTTNIWGVDAGSVTDSAIAMTKSVTVPSGGFMRFAHAHSFESGEGNNYDGGVIEYSTDGRRSLDRRGEPDRGRRPLRGPDLHGAGNPLSGRPAFVGESTGYGSTRLNSPRCRQADQVPLPDRHRRSAERLRLVHRRHRDLQLRRGRIHSPAPASASAAAGRNRERGSRAVAGPGRRRRLRRRPRGPGQGAGEAGEARHSLQTLRAPSDAARRAIRRDGRRARKRAAARRACAA